ncbi:MAG TPA: alpha/beta fold hydrolase [Sandaracinaceae bacterium LLY-WYZ-13_1]|nr:alpha/beta fold hydrolase [Sandaracinaceae bacterium LLY-WYZ-13_1]
MILRTETVEQAIDGVETRTFVKEVLMTPGPHPLGMVRKRLPPPAPSRGAVILVHGYAQNRYTWHSSKRSFVNYLADDGWDVFNVDLRGHGRSRRFGAPFPRTMDDYIREDLPLFVREARELSGQDRVFLVGHSMGGLISYFGGATRVRDQVSGIVSLGSPYVFGQGSALLFGLRELAAAVRFTGLLDANPALPLRIVGRHLNRRKTIWNARLIPLPIRAWAPDTVEPDVLEEYLRRTFDRSTLAVALDIFRAGRDKGFKSADGMIDYSTAFEILDRPLLVVAGTEDGLAPPASVRPAYERSRSSDKTYRAFPYGHIDLVVGKEATRTVWPLIRNWLARRST